MGEKLSFAVENIEFLEEENNSQFATLKIDAFASGPNRHNLYISEETLRKTAPTIIQKPIVWAYNRNSDDASNHTETEIICGFVPHDTPVEFRTLEDGRTMMSIVGKLWTRYSGKLMDIFKRDKNKAVSVEMEVYEEAENETIGMQEILNYCYMGITVLGNLIRPAIPMASAELISFAAKENEEYKKVLALEFSNKYSDIDFTIPKEVKSAAKKSLELYKEKGINANSVSLSVARFLVKNEKATVEKIKAMSDFFNRKVKYDDITIGFYGGKKGAIWSKEIMEKIIEIDERQLSYFGEGEILTFPYSKISDINPALKGIKPPISLAQANEIAAQADAIGGEYGWPTAIKSFKNRHHVENGRWVKNKTVKEELSVEDEKEIEKKEETMAEEKLPESEQKPEEEKPAEKKEEEEKEEKMSLDQNLDLAALLAMLAEETEDYKSLVAKHEAGEEMDYVSLCDKMFAKMKKMQSDAEAAKKDKDVYMDELASLREFKEKIEKQQFDYAVEKTLQEVSDVFSKDEIEDFRKEVTNFSLENLPAWQNNIKSIGFSRIKEAPKKKESFTRMATANSWLNKNSESSEDISKKYAKEGWLPKN